jgi:hypothetical protein
LLLLLLLLLAIPLIAAAAAEEPSGSLPIAFLLIAGTCADTCAH